MADDWTSFSGWGTGKGTGSVREDLLDLIQMTSPKEHPWFAAAPKGKANGFTHQWLVEALAATSTAGAIEGADWAFSSAATTRPVRLENYTMIQSKNIAVSESMRAVDNAGFKDAYQREVNKAAQEKARDVDVIVFNVASGSSSTGASGTARIIRAFQYWCSGATLSTNVTAALSGSGGGASDINVLLQKAWDNGGFPESIYVNAPLKRTISGFTAPSQARNIAASERRLIGVLDFYDTDFGPKEVILDRWVATAAASATLYGGGNHMWFLTQNMNRVAFLRPLMHVLVGKRGDSVAGMVLQEWTLEVLNPSANLFVYGLP